MHSAIAWGRRRFGEASILRAGAAAVQLLASRLAGQAAGFLVALIAARELGPEAFGVFAFAIVAIALLQELPGAGLDLSAVRFSARRWADQPERAQAILRLAGGVKVACSLAVGTLAVLLAMPVATLLDRPALAAPLIVAGVAAIAVAATEFLLAALQSREQFGRIAVVSVVAAAFKLGPVLTLAALGLLTLGSLFGATLVGAYGGLIVAAAAAWPSLRRGGRIQVGEAGELARFARWLVPATLLGAVSRQVDLLAVTALVPAGVAGVYAGGRTLALPFWIAGGALAMVLLPQLSRVATREDLRTVTEGLVARLTIAAAALMLLAVAIAPVVVPGLLGSRYHESIPVFQVLATAHAVQTITWSASALLMALDRPAPLVGLNLAQLVVTATGYVVVAPLGGVAVAGVYLAAVVLMVPAHLVVVHRLLRCRGQAAQPGMG